MPQLLKYTINGKKIDPPKRGSTNIEIIGNVRPIGTTEIKGFKNRLYQILIHEGLELFVNH